MFHFWFLNSGQWQFIGTFDNRGFAAQMSPGSSHLWGLLGNGTWQYLGFWGRTELFPSMQQGRASGMSNFYILQQEPRPQLDNQFYAMAA